MPGEGIDDMTLQFEWSGRQHGGHDRQDDQDNLLRRRRPPDVSVKLTHADRRSKTLCRREGV